MATLASALRVALGVEDSKPLQPHLTLARARDPRGVDATPLLARAAPDGVIAVDELTLYRSHLGSGPAHYEALARVPLSASVSSAVAGR